MAKSSPTTPNSGNTVNSAVERMFAEMPISIDGDNAIDDSGNIVKTDFNPATDDAYYKSAYYVAHEQSVQTFTPTPQPFNKGLDSVLHADAIAAIKKAGIICFHSVGDTGATTFGKFENEESVADLMAKDLDGSPTAPSFFFHLGDVVYNFGEEEYYYQQFYDAYRNYD